MDKKLLMDLSSFQKNIIQSLEPMITNTISREISKTLTKFLALDKLFNEPAKTGYPIGLRPILIPKGVTNIRIPSISPRCAKRFPIGFKLIEKKADIFNLPSMPMEGQVNRRQDRVLDSFHTKIKIKSINRLPDGDLQLEFFEPTEEDVIMLLQFVEVVDG